MVGAGAGGDKIIIAGGVAAACAVMIQPPPSPQETPGRKLWQNFAALKERNRKQGTLISGPAQDSVFMNQQIKC